MHAVRMRPLSTVHDVLNAASTHALPAATAGPPTSLCAASVVLCRSQRASATPLGLAATTAPSSLRPSRHDWLPHASTVTQRSGLGSQVWSHGFARHAARVAC
jgi:hypothetical protein